MQSTQKINGKFATWFTNEFQPAVLVNSLITGLLIFVFELVVVISFAALVFSGRLADQLVQAVGFILIGNAILTITISLLSSYPGSIGVTQDAPSAVLGLVAMQIVVALPVASIAQHYATVVMMIVITTVMTGCLLMTLGIFKLGDLARYLPYPVMGGFLAGTGWLLARGGVDIMINTPFGVEWFEPQSILRWLPGTILGLIILISVSRFRQPATMPVLLVFAILSFYIVVNALGISFERLETGGWVVGSLPSGSLARYPLRAEILSQVNWVVLWNQIPNIIPAAIISVIALLLNSGGLELVIKKDIDLSRELIAAGAGNLLSGALGGMTGYHTVSFSTLNHKMAGGKRLVGLIAALLILLTIILGTSVLRYIPKMILGAVLVYIGTALLFEWVYGAWFKFPKMDVIIILSILGVIMFSSFMNGVIVGLVLAVIIFVLSYSNVRVIKYELSGGDYQSRVTRSSSQRRVLDAEAEQMHILKLQGFIFFGTANGIFKQVRGRIEGKPFRQVRYLLLDFAQISGLDSTGLLSFIRMLHWCQEQNIVLALTGLREKEKIQFARGSFHEQPGSLHFFSDLDHGVEWCENQILAEKSMGITAEGDLEKEFAIILGTQSGVEKLLSYLHRQEYDSGEYLIRQGDEPDTVYFIDSGQVTAQMEVPGQAPLRLETMGSGRIVGELGFYLDIKRTAAVIVDEPSVVYSLSKQELANMESIDSESASLLHRIVVRLLGERVVHLIRTVNALER